MQEARVSEHVFVYSCCDVMMTVRKIMLIGMITATKIRDFATKEKMMMMMIINSRGD